MHYMDYKTLNICHPDYKHLDIHFIVSLKFPFISYKIKFFVLPEGLHIGLTILENMKSLT